MPKQFLASLTLANGSIVGGLFTPIAVDDLPPLPPSPPEVGKSVLGGRSDGSILYIDTGGKLAISPVANSLFYDHAGTIGALARPRTLYVGDGSTNAVSGTIAIWDHHDTLWRLALTVDAAGEVQISEAGMIVNVPGGLNVGQGLIFFDAGDSGGLFVQGAAVPVTDMLIVADNSSVTLMRVNKDGYFFIKKNSAPADGAIATNEVSMWLDSTAGAPVVHFKGKDSATTVFDVAISPLNTWPTRLFSHFANAGNVTTGETDLYSDTTAASTLSANGQTLEAQYGGLYVSSGTATRQIRIYFGGTVIFDTGALTLSLSSAWTAYVTIIRVSATVVRYMISFTTEGAALAAYTAVGEVTGLTLSNTNILKITGQAAGIGAATNDIVAKMGLVEKYPV